MKLSKRLGVTALTLTVSMMFMLSVFAAPMVAGAHDRDHDHDRDHRGSGNAYLKLIRTNAGKLSPSFTKTHYCYKLKVSSHRRSVRIRALRAEEHARVYCSIDRRCWKRGNLMVVKFADYNHNDNDHNGGPSVAPTAPNGPYNPGDNNNDHHDNARCLRVYFKVVAQNGHVMRIYSITIDHDRDHHDDHH